MNRKIKTLIAVGVSITALTILLSSCNSSTTNNKIDKEALKPEKVQTEEERNAEIQAGANWLRSAKEEKKPIQIAPAPLNRDTQIASIILTASCAGKTGLIPRSKMGSTIKKMLEDKNIDVTRVYEDWNYYSGIAKEMDAVNKTYCLK